MVETPLDHAFAAMHTGEAQRLAYFASLAATEVFLLIEGEPGDTVRPRVFEIEDQSFVVVFDTEQRLSAFAGQASLVALSGRALAQMLSGQNLGLALNPDLPSALLLPADAVAWLAEISAATPKQLDGRPTELHAPKDLPQALLTALDARFAAAEGLAEAAILSGVRWADGRLGHLLAVVGSLPDAHQSLAQAVQEALSFSGLEAGELDVAFLDPSDPMVEKLSNVGLRFDFPQPTQATHPAAPGMDPDRPPRLR